VPSSPESDPTDVRLAERARSGDRDAFAELVGRHHARVLGLCRSWLGSGEAAEDAAQDVFLKAYQALGSFRGTSAFSTWLYRIAVNRCMDVRRSAARARQDSLDALIEERGDDLYRLLGQAPDASTAPEAGDLARRLLAALPDDYRTILWLREVEGFTYEELTRALDCSLDAVKARLRRARAEVEEKLRHFSGSEGV
jgi:RNA polymerase sigma-70 factor (ECF subfamily)